ncbi:MAG: AI-2E family transporter [Candidatus Berkelbacteria bacterium]|nr:AI-2E family transporter [Candidatus Berkelbacteria bacterium]
MTNTNQKISVDISSAAILKVFGIALLIWFLWYIREIIIVLFVVGILVATFSPLVERMYGKKVPRILSVILIYIVLILLFALLVYLIVPPVVVEVNKLTQNLPGFIERVSPIYYQSKQYLPSFQKGLENIAGTLNSLTTNVWSATLTIFGGLVSFVTILVLTFYMLLEKESRDNLVASFLPVDRKDSILKISQKVGQKLGAWLRGQLFLALIIGIVDFIILAILGVPYVLILAILAAILEIIPTLGPVLAAVPAILIALTVSPWTGLIVAVAYLGVQQLENHILVPKVMGKAVGLSPVIVIVALLIGAKILGIAGAILAIPAAAALQVLISEWRKLRSSA